MGTPLPAGPVLPASVPTASLTTALLVWSWLYPVGLMLLTLGLLRLPRRSALQRTSHSPRPDTSWPSVSVVVSARNEADTLPACLRALLALDYPIDRLQLVLVNDRSTDDTGAQMEAAAAAHAHVTVVHTEQCPENGLEAKARGVAHGIARATGEWVLITDADATVPAQWAHTLLANVTPATAIVGGVALVEPQPAAWWGRVEDVVWTFLQVINMGMAGWGVPAVSSGPNMGIRRAVYLAGGGLEAAPFRIAEDIALFRLAQARGGRAQLSADATSTVSMRPVPSPWHVISQLRRWVGGALESGPAYRLGVPLAVLWGVGVVAMLLGGWWVSPRAWGTFLLAKLLVDGLALALLAARVGRPLRPGDVPVLWVTQVVMVLWLPVSFLVSRRIAWRGEGYAVRY